MIISFKCKKTKEFWESGKSKRLPNTILSVALRKLFMLDSAYSLDDLTIPPNNKLESLKGDRNDQWSIRINQQWRLCFKWKEHDAYDVEIVDYH